jgi:hypothetical protein
MVNFSAVVAQALLSGRADAIIAADRAGIIRFWNPGADEGQSKRAIGFGSTVSKAAITRESVIGVRIFVDRHQWIW